MKIGISLPAAIPGVEARTLLEWARRSEQSGFAAVSILDRLVFNNYEALTTLAAVAAVTERVQLVTAVLLAPLRTNVALFAKQAATVDRLSGGRLTLGLGVGNRADDFEAAGADFHRRGRSMDRQIAELRSIWTAAAQAGEGGAHQIGPAPAQPGGPKLLVGGRSEAALRRAGRLADGWIQGSGGPALFREGSAAVRAAWQAAGRDGEPRFIASARFALGVNAREQAEASNRAYYGAGGARGDATGGALMTPEAIREIVAGFEQAGCQEINFNPGSGELGQIEALAAILF